MFSPYWISCHTFWRLCSESCKAYKGFSGLIAPLLPRFQNFPSKCIWFPHNVGICGYFLYFDDFNVWVYSIPKWVILWVFMIFLDWKPCILILSWISWTYSRDVTHIFHPKFLQLHLFWLNRMYNLFIHVFKFKISLCIYQGFCWVWDLNLYVQEIRY